MREAVWTEMHTVGSQPDILATEDIMWNTTVLLSPSRGQVCEE